MSDLKFSLPGPETVSIARQSIEKLMRAGDSDAALLYLYILKTDGMGTSSEASVALGKSPGWIAAAMAVLSRLGLVQLDNKVDDDQEDFQPDERYDEPEPEPRRYSIEDMKRELASGSVFALIVEETQRSLGKILSPDELLRLLGIYDSLSMPPEVILQLITHCIAESRMSGGGRPPSMRYIEKAAYTWEREGILTLDKAEEYIKILNARRSVRGEIKNVLQIKGREFSATELRYVEGWIEMGFDASTIGIAYDRTLVKTGKMVWGYMDTILKSWHTKGIHTAKDALEKDKWPPVKSAHNNQKSSGNKHNAPNREDLERMQRMLEKIKGD